MTEVVLQNLSKTFSLPKRRVEAVKDFTLSVSKGEFVVLVGPSGAGKTTVLRLIAGLEEVTGGTISIDGQVVNEVPPEDRDVAMVFQSFALYPHMTVAENIGFPLKLRRKPKREIAEGVQQAAELVGVAQLLDRKPSTLSGGERQRVAVARAIVRRPKVFLFDEPLSNLDPTMRSQLRVEIARLHQRLSATMIYVTHDQIEAMTLGDRIVVMNEGTIQQIGSALDLYSKPANIFVAGFIGSPPMNLIHGQIREKGQEFMFVADEGEARVLFVLDREQARSVHNLPDRRLVLGLRPEDISLSEGRSPNSVGAVVELVEPTGAESFVHLRAGSILLVMRARGTTPLRIGEHASIICSLQKAHFFDAVSGRRLAPN